MQHIKSRPNRNEECGVYLKDGDFKYKAQHSWVKWPPEPKGKDVLGLCCDAEDNLYATNSHLDYPICIFSPEGDFIRAIGQGLFDRPHSVFVTPDNTLLVADSGPHLHAIREIDMDGKLVRNYGNPFQPSNSGFDANAFINAKISGEIPPDAPYSIGAEFALQTKTIKRVAPPFNKPCNMVIAPNGEMFAADGYGNSAVHKFSADGTLVKSWGGPGTEIGKFALSHYVWADKYNRIWSCDRENHRAYAFDTAGDIIALVEGGFRRIVACWSDDRNVYFAEAGGALSIIDIDSLEIAAQFGFDDLNLLRCHGICGDSKGNLFISSISDARAIGNLIRFERM